MRYSYRIEVDWFLSPQMSFSRAVDSEAEIEGGGETEGETDRYREGGDRR